MGDFKKFEKLKEELEMRRGKNEEKIDLLPVAPDNGVDTSEAVEAVKEALSSFVNKQQVVNIVRNELMSNPGMKNVTLLREGVPEKLPEELRHYLFPEILTTVNLGIPAALIGPAGSGKSTVSEQIAKALKLRFFLQNGVTGTHELTGYMDAHGRYNTTPFRDAFENGGLIMVDEVDTSEAGALKWLNTALANGHAGFPDRAEPVRRHDSFRIIIAANTWGSGADRLYVGANQLDASTLDRFVFFDFQYDEKLEMLVSGNVNWTERVQLLRKNAFEVHARIVISPRASINGAKLIKAGWSWNEVEERVIWKGIDLELKDRILNPRKKADNDNDVPKQKKRA
jgi:cobaltochelatase CobS